MTRLVAAGLSFRTAPLAVREAAAVAPDQARNLLRYLVGHSGFGAAAVLSTCNRTEFYVSCPDDAAGDVAARIAPLLDITDERDVLRHFTASVEEPALRHLFRVAAGLDSMVLGEVQVLGQLRDAHRLAHDAGTLDARLDFVLRRAISVGKLVHSTTGLGRGAGSLSEIAVSCARALAGDLDGRGVLLVGAGKMNRLAARRLREMGARILVTSRGASKTALARAVDATTVDVDELAHVAAGVDVLVCSTASGHPVISRALVEEMQLRRGSAPLCIVDIAVPRDVDPAAASVPGVTLIDIDQLGRRLDGHLAARRQAVPAAERVIETELARTMTVIGQRDAAGPTIAALIRSAEALRRREVERTVARAPQLDADARERIDSLTASLVRKLLHGPIEHLRATVDDPSVALTLRQAFGLDEGDAAAAPRTPDPAAGSRG